MPTVWSLTKVTTMAQLDNATPFAATLMPSSDRNGSDLLLLVVAAQFDLPVPAEAGRPLQVSAAQAPVPLADVYLGEPGRSSLRDEGQVAYTRPATDIYLRGHAVAPGGQALRQMPVGLRVGPCSVQMQVHGDRVWERAYGRGAVPSKALPFTRMPLTWERAWGGVAESSTEQKPAWEPRNPVGCGFEVDPAAAVDRPVPNLEDPDDLLGQLSDRPVPVGVGPVARHWQPRASHAGTYDADWQRQRAPLWPDDFSLDFFNAAPPALQARTPLRGGEPAKLIGVHADGPLQFLLPKLRLESRHQFAGLPDQRAVPVLDGVQIDTDAMRLTLYYRAALSASLTLARHRASLLRLRQPWEVLA